MTGGKRANGEGGIYYRDARSRWEATTTVGRRRDGRPIRQTVTGRTRAEVLARLTELQARVKVATEHRIGLTVAEWIEWWLEHVLPNEAVRQVTRDLYASDARRYVVPSLGRTRLDKLSPSDVDRMISQLRAEGYAAATIHHAYRTLYRALEVATRRGLTSRNVAALVDGPRGRRPKERTITVEEIHRIRDHVRGHRYEALVVTLIATGLRRGELAALTWGDLELDRDDPAVTVRRTLVMTSRGLDLGPPKTRKGVRRIPLAPYAVEVLRRHRREQAEERLAYGPGWGGEWSAESFVFATAIGTPIHPDNVSHYVAQLGREAGIGAVHPHAYRHTFGTRMIEGGAQLLDVSLYLGHSSLSFTADVYCHVVRPHRSIAPEVERIMFGR